MTTKIACDIENCPKEVYAANLCEAHYRRANRLKKPKKPGAKGPRLSLSDPIQRYGQDLVDMNTRVSGECALIIEEMTDAGESVYARAARLLEEGARAWKASQRKARGSSSSNSR